MLYIDKAQIWKSAQSHISDEYRTLGNRKSIFQKNLSAGNKLMKDCEGNNGKQ